MTLFGATTSLSIDANFQTRIKTNPTLEMPILFVFRCTPVFHPENSLVTPKILKKSQSGREKILVWDKEIPPSDLNNFVRNLTEPHF